MTPPLRLSTDSSPNINPLQSPSPDLPQLFQPYLTPPSISSQPLSPPMSSERSIASSIVANPLVNIPISPAKLTGSGSHPPTPNDGLTIFGDVSSDGFGGQDQNDELACKIHYRFFEV